jgi:hypothetical protein
MYVVPVYALGADQKGKQICHAEPRRHDRDLQLAEAQICLQGVVALRHAFDMLRLTNTQGDNARRLFGQPLLKKSCKLTL